MLPYKFRKTLRFLLLFFYIPVLSFYIKGLIICAIIQRRIFGRPWQTNWIHTVISRASFSDIENIHIWALPRTILNIHMFVIFKWLAHQCRWIIQRAFITLTTSKAKSARYAEIIVYIYTRICCLHISREIAFVIICIYIIPLFQGCFRTLIPFYKSLIRFNLAILSSFDFFFGYICGEARLDVFLEGKLDLLHLYPHWLRVWYKGYTSRIHFDLHYRWLGPLYTFPDRHKLWSQFYLAFVDIGFVSQPQLNYYFLIRRRKHIGW